MIILIVFLLFSLHTCNKDNTNSLRNESNDSTNQISSDSVTTLTENQKKIFEGARKTLEDSAVYDLSMGYYVLKYENGEYVGKKVYPNGDLNPEIGVCTDVIIRALRYAGIVDLQEAVHEDLAKNWSDYPMKRWGAKKPDSNIDHRRVMNLQVWFGKYWHEMDFENFEPGDVVVWDMNQDGVSDHIGIVTDKQAGSRYFVIHNHPDPGHIAEEDKLFKWEMTGHYRIKD
jgi:uncharacterized protein YijF (DUF1287 family)